MSKQKPQRWYIKKEGNIEVYNHPFTSKANQVSVEYNKTLTEVRKLYSNFTLREVWDNLQ
jgi:hypothetical protein